MARHEKPVEETATAETPDETPVATPVETPAHEAQSDAAPAPDAEADADAAALPAQPRHRDHLAGHHCCDRGSARPNVLVH